MQPILLLPPAFVVEAITSPLFSIKPIAISHCTDHKIERILISNRYNSRVTRSIGEKPYYVEKTLLSADHCGPERISAQSVDCSEQRA